MTSKEFVRRVKYWSVWTVAFALFKRFDVEYIWKVTLFELSGVHSVSYRNQPYLLPPDLIDVEVANYTVERYSKVCFQTDLRFFNSFLSKLTPYQLDILKNDPQFINLLNFVFNEKK